MLTHPYFVGAVFLSYLKNKEVYFRKETLVLMLAVLLVTLAQETMIYFNSKTT
jgi:hypothetical protein